MGSETMDVLERLNRLAADWFLPNSEMREILAEAAAEIARLRDERAQWQGLAKTQGAVLEIMERERKSHDRMPVVNRNQKLGL